MSKLPEMPKAAGSDRYFKLTALKDLPGNCDDIRILSDFVVGFEGWKDNGKKGEPVRHPSLDDFDPNTKWMIQDGKPRKPKPFAAAWGWNPRLGVVQLVHFTQVTITDAIALLEKNKKWGDIGGYDITITRTEKDGKISYQVTPGPKEPLSAEAQAAWDEVREACVGPVALFSGGDPFTTFDAAPVGKDSDIPFD